MDTNGVPKKYILQKILGIAVLIFLMLVNTAGAAPFAYIVNYGSNAVYVIDIATNNVTATVDVGSEPFGVAVSPDETKVYVTNTKSNTTSVIDTATNMVAVTIPVGIGPMGIAVSPDGTKVFVTNTKSNTTSVIDTATNMIAATIPVGMGLMGIAVSPDGTKVYVTNTKSNTTSVIDTTTNRVVATIPMGIGPMGIAVSPDGTKVYATNTKSNTTSVIDTATNMVAATITVGIGPLGVAVTPDGTKVYVTNAVSNTISVIDTATNIATTTVLVGKKPFSFGKFIGSRQLLLPVADFSVNPTNGIPPLSVQFKDLSQNAVSRNWDFGDETISTEQNPTHIYSSEGNYTVNLIVNNTKGNSSKTAIIIVQNDGGSDGSSSSGGSSHISGGGGAGGSPEPQSNIVAEEISQTFIGSGQLVNFAFPRKVTPVENISFNSKKELGKTTTIVEMLREKSTLVTGLPSDEIYKFINIWVGNSGFATSQNIENVVVNFKVEKSWTQDKNIDKSSITLNRYNGQSWDQLQTSLSGEDDIYLYYTAQTSDFSIFAITGNSDYVTIFLKKWEQKAQIMFTQSEKMKVGESKIVKAYISKNTSEQIPTIIEESKDSKVITSYQNNFEPVGRSKSLTHENITVTPLMKVTLVSKENGVFDIETIPPDFDGIQPIIGGDTTIWEWKVTPHDSGKHTLLLDVYYVISLSSGSNIIYRKYSDVQEIEEKIDVEINPLYTVESYWQWLIGVIIIPSSAFIYHRLKNRQNGENK